MTAKKKAAGKGKGGGLSIVYRRLDQIKHLPRNAKAHDIGAIAAAIRAYGMLDPLGINGQTGHDMDGNGRLATLRAMMAQDATDAPRNIRIDPADGMWLIPTVEGIDLNAAQEEAAAIALNRVHDLGGYDNGTLAAILSDLATAGQLEGTGYDGDDLDALLRFMATPPPAVTPGPKLSDRFLVPPFSVLDARQGYWQDRKRAWIGIGIQSEVGRGENLQSMSDVANTPGGYAELVKQHQNSKAIPSGRGTPTDRAADGEQNGFAPAGRKGRVDSRAFKDHAWQAEKLGHVQASSNTVTVKLRKSKANAIPGGSREPLARAKNGEQSVWDPGRKGRPRGGAEFAAGKPLTYTGHPADYQKGYAADKANAGLSEKEKRALGGYAAFGGSTVKRGQGRREETPNLEGGLLFGTTIDGYRKEGQGRGESAAIAGLTVGTSIHPYREQQGISTEGSGTASLTGTSIFDPVLCEIAYRWFCPPRARILDPFAGGSVRGIVAGVLDHDYTGIDLRPEQVAANRQQAKAINPKRAPKWVVGDSRDLRKHAGKKPYDFIFSCPPYYDLEIYSEDPTDLSNAGTYAAFSKDYAGIIGQAIDLLKPNRFACFVVGDLRDKKGFYRNFVSDTIAAFQTAGALLYNEAILVTAVGSLPIRIGNQFGNYRKVGKTHQNVLVFFKGDPKQIPIDFPAIEAVDPLESHGTPIPAPAD